MTLEELKILNEVDPQLVENLLLKINTTTKQTEIISDYKVGFPFHNWYDEANGKNFGDKIEDWLKSDVFSDLEEKTSEEHDALFNGKRIEIKVVRSARSPMGDGSHLKTRALVYDNKKPFKGVGSFLQVKPTTFDYMIAVILYKDAMALYLIESDDISSKTGKENKELGKIMLSKQHRGHSTEGSISGKEINKYLVGVYNTPDIKLKFSEMI